MNYKYRFQNDYTEGAHQNILDALTKTNLQQDEGYGNDSFCEAAKKLIQEQIQNPQAAIHFTSGGTQANIISLASMLKPYESVIAPVTSHISEHEAGAIEATGHKINTVISPDGKIKPEQINKVVEEHAMFGEHMVKPAVVFISQATELGTVYSKQELTDISTVCKKHNLYLYLDGARIGVGLTASNSDITLPELSALVDIFYIGATKNGGLIGEAIVINNKNLQMNFRYHLKQRGALLAKGRILGIQFSELFKDNLYFSLAKHANLMATKLTEGIKACGYTFLADSTTNQIFPIFPNAVITKMQSLYGFYVWSKKDEQNSAVRIVTSWATKEEAVDEFLADLKTLK
jgi:threonine aldolase